MFRFRTAKSQNRPGSFSVDDVKPASKPLPADSLGGYVARRLRRELIFVPEQERPVAHDHLSHCHPLVDAVATAFNQHRPLTLSPDAIWLTIEQGFAHHVAENAEALRHRLVRHQGRRQLVVDILDLSPLSFQRAISEFSAQIREATDPVMHATLLCDFSTTTPTIRTASEVVLMDCYSSYFDFSNSTVMCGRG